MVVRVRDVFGCDALWTFVPRRGVGVAPTINQHEAEVLNSGNRHGIGNRFKT